MTGVLTLIAPRLPWLFYGQRVEMIMLFIREADQAAAVLLPAAGRPGLYMYTLDGRVISGQVVRAILQTRTAKPLELFLSADQVGQDFAAPIAA